MFTAQVIPAHLGWSIKHNTMFKFFMVVGLIFLPVLINHLCWKYISITVWFKLNRSNWDCHCDTISVSHYLKHLFYGISRSSNRPERTVEIWMVRFLSPPLPGEGAETTWCRKPCVWWKKKKMGKGSHIYLDLWKLETGLPYAPYSSARFGRLWRSKSTDSV